jgi:hypothetical protein
MSHKKLRNPNSKSRDRKLNGASNQAKEASKDALFDKIANMELQPLRTFEIPLLVSIHNRFHK